MTDMYSASQATNKQIDIPAEQVSSKSTWLQFTYQYSEQKEAKK